MSAHEFLPLPDVADERGGSRQRRWPFAPPTPRSRPRSCLPSRTSGGARSPTVGGRIVRVAVTCAGVARGRQLRQLPSRRTSRRCGGIPSRYPSSSSRRARSRRWSPQPASPCSLEAAVDDLEGIAFSRNAVVEPLALLTCRHEHLASCRVASAKRLVLVQVPTPEGRSISVFSVALHQRRWTSG